MRRRILEIVAETGDFRPSDNKALVTEFRYDPSHVSRVVRQMEAEGLIIRYRTELTEKGKALLKGGKEDV